ncbi:MAG: hypothetical protein WC746_06480 [archaeon]
MDLSLRLSAILVLILILISGANAACNINISSLDTEVRSTGDYYSSVASDYSQDIDTRVTFYVSSYSGSDCPSNINAKAIVSRYNETTNAWSTYLTTEQKSQSLTTGTYSIVWDNAFNTGSNTNFTRFRVEGLVLNGSTELDRTEAYVDVQDNSCSGVKLNTTNITINEGTTNTRTFTIENNTDNSFSVSSMDVMFTSSLIKSGSVDYDSPISAHSTRNITLTLDSGFVSSNQTTTGTLKVSGNLGNATCSMYDIGQKNFSVTVQNTGSNDNGDYYSSGSTSSDCGDIDLIVRDFTMDEASETKVAFSVKNNSTKRFEVTDVALTSNGLDLSNYYNEKYVFSGQVSDVIVKAVAPNVAQNKIFNNSIKVRGVFTDGRSCSFEDIYSKTFNTTIVDNPTQNSNLTNCGSFSISTPAQLTVQNYGTAKITISNGTNAKATVYVEGTVDAQPSVIVLPANTSISREINFSIFAQTGELVFRPVIEGCYPSLVKTQVTNNANGSLNQVKLTTSTREDQNTGNLLLTLGINNSTNKTFVGLAIVTVPGYATITKTISAAPGSTSYELVLVPNGELKVGNGKVTFQSNGEEITQEINPSGSGFAGLFAFGANFGGLGLLLLILVAAVLLAAIISERNNSTTKETDQQWVEQSKE